jgi:hypothetical protein
MANIDLDFEWTRGLTYECVGGVIRQTSKKKERVPFEKTTNLYSQFAELDVSPEDLPKACLGFAHRWGLLTTPASWDAEKSLGAQESLDTWRREIKKMKSLQSMVKMVRTANSRRVRLTLTTIDVALQSGEFDDWNARPALVLQPRSLLSAMLLQLAHSRASGSSMRKCEECGKPFEVGISASRRSIARFCSASCKNRNNYLRRIEK